MKKNLFFLLLSFIMFGSSSAWALSQVDGVYQIGTADELIEFAGIVNGGETTASAVLTDDIDMTGKTYTPIGGEGHAYNGTFDGQGHVIDNLDLSANYDVYDEQGIFGRVAGSGTTIKNLVSGPNNKIMGKARVGGLIGAVAGSGWLYLENCGNEAYVKCSRENAGGIMGVVFNGGPATQLTNCYNTGNVYGGWDSAIITGWAGGHGSVKYLGFWNTGVVENGEDSGMRLWRNNSGITYERIYSNFGSGQGEQAIDTDDLASGAFAYMLNGNVDAGMWLQNLEGNDKDAHPTLIGTHGKVYANGDLNCDGSSKGTASYSNTEGSNRDPHTWDAEWGFCSVCDEINPDFLSLSGGYYELGTKQQLNWFAEYVKRIDNTVNGKLTADIDFSSIGNEMIGPEDGNPFKGIFDGQGHKVIVSYDANQKNSALFRYIQGATIKNLIVDGTISNTNSCSGGIFAGSRGASVVENCVSYVTFNRTADGDATFGGIGAYMHDNGTVRNCAYLGIINAPNANGNGGILGYANGGSNVKIQHCLLNATISVADGGGDPFVRNTDPTDSYFVERGNLNSHNQGTQVTAAQIASGEVAYLLNGSVSGGETWYQLIGTDANPLPLAQDGAKVYANGVMLCDGSIDYANVTFSNTEGTSSVADHQITDGVCSVCGNWFIETPAQLKSFAEKYTANQTKSSTVTAYLLNNLDMAGVAFDGIGSNDRRFEGKLIGQNHVVISNLKMSADRNGVGLVNTATVGAEIKNITIDATCSFAGESAVAAFIGAVRGDNGALYIENCLNEAPVSSTGANAAGFLGCKYDNDVIPHFTNCLQVGIIKSGNDGGSFSGWMPKAVMVNCVSYIDNERSSGLETGYQFARGWSINLTNCFDCGLGSESDGYSGTWGSAFADGRKFTEAEMADGTLLTKLQALDAVWALTTTGAVAHPAFVAQVYVPLNEQLNHTLTTETRNVYLERTLVADTWNTLILPFEMTAAEVTELFGEGTQTATLKANGYDAETNNYAFEDGGSMISAGWPFLVKPTKAMTVATFTGKELTNDIISTDTYFVGSYNPQAVAVGDKLVGAGNKLLTVGTAGKIKAFRAYFPAQTGGEAKDATFTIDGEVTGIIGINGEIIETTGNIYDLQGRKVSKPQHGVYIVNGKKVVMK